MHGPYSILNYGGTMGLDITFKKNNESLYYCRSDYNLLGWLIDFSETPLRRENVEDLILACESCLRNPLLVDKLFVSPSSRKGYTKVTTSDEIKYWLIPLRRAMKNILKEWDDTARYWVDISM
jgi:hypothetical protein